MTNRRVTANNPPPSGEEEQDAPPSWPPACVHRDVVRSALTFKTPEALADCYEACAGSAVAGLRLLHTVNNLSRTHDAAVKDIGYRSVILNCLATVQVTWGDLFDADTTGFLPRVFSVGQEVREVNCHVKPV